MLDIHLTDKTTEKRQNFDPSTPLACAQHLHFMLNGETRKAPGLTTRSSSTHPAIRSWKACKSGSRRKTLQEMGEDPLPM
jgi:hypothetical protein